MTDFGIDVSSWQVDAFGNAVPKLDPFFRPITGKRLLCEVALRRCFNLRGSYLQIPDSGYDILSEVNKATPEVNEASIAEKASTSVRKDERFANAVATVTFVNGKLTLNMMLYPADGSPPFPLTVSVADVATAPKFTIAFPPGAA